MIYTQWGVPVKIIAVLSHTTRVRVQDINDPDWIRERDISDLKADGGIAEINKAIASAPIIQLEK